MNHAITVATLKAARIGTAKIAGDPMSPPNTCERAVVGSTVAAAMELELDRRASVVVGIMFISRVAGLKLVLLLVMAELGANAIVCAMASAIIMKETNLDMLEYCCFLEICQ